MKYIGQVLHYLLIEPSTWLFYWCFQPKRFRREIDLESTLKRLSSKGQLALPIFLLTYPLVLALEVIFYKVSPVSAPWEGKLLLIIALGILEGAVLGFLTAMTLAASGNALEDITLGIFGALAGGFILVIPGNATASLTTGIVLGIASSFLLAIILAYNKKSGILLSGGCVIICLTIGVGEEVIISHITNITNIIMEGLIGGAIGSILIYALAFPFSWISLIVGGIKYVTSGGDAFKIRTAKKGIISGCFLQIILIGIAVAGAGGVSIASAAHLLDISRFVKSTADIITGNISRGLIWGILGGITGWLAGKGIERVFVGAAETRDRIVAFPGDSTGAMWGFIWSVLGSATNNFLWNLIGMGIFLVCYITTLYRLPFYPLSVLSAFWTLIASWSNPTKVFTYLHNSSFYWDECTLLSLPGLRYTMLVAAAQDAEEALKDLGVIVAERPWQTKACQDAARVALLNVIIQDLETCRDLQSIAQFYENLNNIISQKAVLFNPEWTAPFIPLLDASQDAARYCNSLDWQIQHSALADMEKNLQKVNFLTAFSDAQLNSCLEKIVRAWLEAAQRPYKRQSWAEEQKKASILQQIEARPINNPYKPGPILRLNDAVFVGRRDLAQQLENALSKENYRPTFLLNGERRMGKSSTLMQLPKLLGSHYLPVFFDLQKPGITSNSAIFLKMFAKEIHKETKKRGIEIPVPEDNLWTKARQESEQMVYNECNQWLDYVEELLEQENRTLLLTFDEFERLEEVMSSDNFNLTLLLNWLRNIIQYRPRLALLFSGVGELSEMGARTKVNWASYFVNVQTLHVGFLQQEEARQLILQPVPDFPGKDIFEDEIVDNIIFETNKHPFLMQSVCFRLIENLNAEKRKRAMTHDVERAVHETLDRWWTTYFRDMWERTSEEQRVCLEVVKSLQRADIFQIEQQSKLDKSIVHHTMEALLRRDLVIRDETGVHHIAAPIFSKWIGRILHY